MNPEKRIAESSWGILAKVMDTLTLDDAYYFKGSTE